MGLRYNDRLAGLCRVCPGGIALLPAKPGKNVISFEKKQIPTLDFPFTGALQRFKEFCFQTRLRIRTGHARSAQGAEAYRSSVQFVVSEEIIAPRKTRYLLLSRIQRHVGLFAILRRYE